MTRKEWILANLKGKVQKRALRAIEEQPQCDEYLNGVSAVDELFFWDETKERVRYWIAIYDNKPNPDQYLPENYVDVDHVPDNGEMVRDEFLEWLEYEMEGCLSNQNNWTYEVLRRVKNKYNELKNSPALGRG